MKCIPVAFFSLLNVIFINTEFLLAEAYIHPALSLFPGIRFSIKGA
jgi:hypothetical protein